VNLYSTLTVTHVLIDLSGISVRNTQAFKVLQTVFLKVRTHRSEKHVFSILILLMKPFLMMLPSPT